MNEIFEIVKQVLQHLQKPADFYTVGEDNTITDAPVVIIKGGDGLHNGQAIFHQLDIHMLLVHKIDEEIPQGYASFEAYVSEYEKLADNLPKAGCMLYFEDDDVALLMGKKEREDVKEIEYTGLPATKTDDGFVITLEGDTATIRTTNTRFPNHAAGAKALLNRIGVIDSQFISALKSLS